MTFRGEKIEIRVRELEGHTNILKKILFYASPKDIIITCSSDSSIKKWSLREYKCLETFLINKGELTDIIKWGESNDEVLCCGFKYNITCHSVNIGLEVVKSLHLKAVELRRVDEDIFACMRTNNSMFIASYSKGVIQRELEGLFGGALIQSKKYADGVLCSHWKVDHQSNSGGGYMSRDDSVSLFDFKKGIALENYMFPSAFSKKFFRLSSSFINEKKEEILICHSSYTRVIIFCRPTSPTMQVDRVIQLNKGGGLYASGISCIKYFKEGFLICCGHNGTIMIIGLNDDCKSMDTVLKRKDHSISEWIMSLEVIERTGSSIRFAASHFDGMLRILEFTNLPISQLSDEENDKLKDLEERIEFMITESLSDDERRIEIRFLTFSEEKKILTVPKLLWH